MSKIRVEKDGIKIKLPKMVQETWKQIEEGECGTADLFYIKDIDPQIANMLAFLAVSNEMLGAYLDNWRYIFGDVDCLDMEEYNNSLIVRVEV